MDFSVLLALSLIAILSVVVLYFRKTKWNLLNWKLWNLKNKRDSSGIKSSKNTTVRLYNDNDLSSIRANITSLDLEILNLLSSRRKLVEAVAQYKIKNGLPVRDAVREAELLERLTNEAEKLNVTSELVKNLFELIMKDSRSRQAKIIEAESE